MKENNNVVERTNDRAQLMGFSFYAGISLENSFVHLHEIGHLQLLIYSDYDPWIYSTYSSEESYLFAMSWNIVKQWLFDILT